jgi:cation diffusion facilitator CzcD-associated flavoprotein CzcO
MEWDDTIARWHIRTDRGDDIRARFVVSALGPMSRPKLPGIEGITTFEGHTFHTSRWDYDYTGGNSDGGLDRLADKRVGIIGTGATAVQCVPHLGAAAQELFVEWSTDLHCNLIANEPDALLRQHFSKFEKLFGGLALILHLAEGSVGPVGVATAARAAAWTQYLAQHARRIYALADGARVSAAQTLVKRLKAGKLADDFTARDVVRKGWTSLSTTREAEAALATLEEFGYVAGFDDADREGRPTTRYRVNPAIGRVPS